MEAARIAAKRGHEVDLYEKDNEIGGQMNVACVPPFKQHLGLLKPYLERQLELTGVNVHLGKEMTRDDILALNPDAVVCATGVKPARLPIPGVERAVHAKRILRGEATGKRVVIVGGGSVGCETAELLATKGKTVTVVEMLGELASNTGKTAQTILIGHLKSRGVKLLTGCRVERIDEACVLCKKKDGEEFTVPADTVVLAVGDVPETSLFDSLKDDGLELYNIGDANGGGIIPNAVYEGYTVGCKI